MIHVDDDVAGQTISHQSSSVKNTPYGRDIDSQKVIKLNSFPFWYKIDLSQLEYP